MGKLLIFDFDGTIVDTITDVGLCFNEALMQNGFPQHPLEAFGAFVGGDLETVVSRMLPEQARSPENIDRVKTVYRRLYLSNPKPNTKPYPGIMRVLAQLKASGHHLAVNSNKGQALLEDLVRKLFPADFFESVVGYEETRPSKPSPAGVDLICSQCRCERKQAVYIGDGHSDIETAVNAGIPCVLVKWGQGTQQDFADVRVADFVETASQLYEALA